MTHKSRLSEQISLIRKFVRRLILTGVDNGLRSACKEMLIEYDRLIEELEKSKRRNQFTNSNWPHEKGLHDKIQSLEAEVERLQVFDYDHPASQVIRGLEAKLQRQDEMILELEHVMVSIAQESWSIEGIPGPAKQAVDCLTKLNKLRGRDSES